MGRSRVNTYSNLFISMKKIFKWIGLALLLYYGLKGLITMIILWRIWELLH